MNKYEAAARQRQLDHYLEGARAEGRREGFVLGVLQAAILAETHAGEDVGDWTYQNAAKGRHYACLELAAAIRALAVLL